VAVLAGGPLPSESQAEWPPTITAFLEDLKKHDASGSAMEQR
jgi:hypothetical protein